MSERDHPEQPETIDDDVADAAGELMQDAGETLEERREEQQEFLDTVAEEEGAEVLETQCNLIGDYTVPLRAKMNGELMDRVSAVQEQGQRIEEHPREEGHKASAIADEMCQLLADVIDDADWSKEKFYAAYREEGLEPILAMLERAFESLKKERERVEGTAKGFRGESGGS